MWACALGKTEAAAVLLQWNSSTISVCNKDGSLPLTIARNKGQSELLSHLEHILSSPQDPLKLPLQVFTTANPTVTLNSPLTLTSTPPPVTSTSFSMSPQGEEQGGSDWGNLEVEIPPPPPYPGGSLGQQAEGAGGARRVPPSPVIGLQDHQGLAVVGPAAAASTSMAHHEHRIENPNKDSSSLAAAKLKLQTRLRKRISIEVLQENADTNKDDNVTMPTMCKSEIRNLRNVNSDPDLGSLMHPMTCGDNPMISVNDRDLNSPIMFMQTDQQGGLEQGHLHGISAYNSSLSIDSGMCEKGHVAMETGEILLLLWQHVRYQW